MKSWGKTRCGWNLMKEEVGIREPSDPRGGGEGADPRPHQPL